MPSVCFYFQVHQPFRLKRYSFFDIGKDHDYFDSDKNEAISQKVAHKCYLPTNQVLLDLIKQYRGAFRLAFSITGTAIEQMRLYAPEALASFVELSKTGCVEFLAETYHHSLSSLYDEEEFREQVRLHRELMLEVFGYQPRIFRNTELIYSDAIGALVSDMGFRGCIAEGADDIVGWRSPNFIYSMPGRSTRLLLKNYRLSDDVAFRFSNRGWECYPLTAEKYAGWIHSVSGAGDTVNLFMDFETFGEHQWASTGIFEFLKHLPGEIFKHKDWNFATPSEVLELYPSRAEMAYPRVTSWADVDRDTSAWRGNRMQLSALEQIYDLGKAVRWQNDPQALAIWRKLLTSDHFYYMCTKWFADGDVHAYFSPYESPYEGFINYMNALKDFKAFYLGRGSEEEEKSGG
ncbi:MAG: glycoside hydrolase family 57 protein [Oligoflexia bacterium]|nr:glycoside hydrolase family 57 protein [Oligoflexia bacterium]